MVLHEINYIHMMNAISVVTFSVIELPSMELLVLCPVRQLTGEQPQS